MADQDIRVEIKATAEEVRRAARLAIREIRDVAQETRRADTQIVASNAVAERSLAKLEKRQAGLAQASRNFGASWRAIGWASLIANIGPATAGIADLGVAITGAGTALAPLAGTVATLPNLLGSMGQAGIVTTLAFRGMEKALAGDEKALKALTPEAQRFVKTIRGEVGPAVRDLQKISQAGLLPGVTAGVHSLMRDLPVVKKITGDTAKELGELAEQAGKQFSTNAFQKDLATFGETNVKVIGRLGDAGLHAADGLRHITIAAQPLVNDLSKGIDTLAGKFENWAQKAREDGTLADFFDLTGDRVHQSVDILGNLAGVLGHVAGAAQPLAGHLMQGLVEDTQKLADLTGSKAGQSTLAKFFSDAETPLREVSHLARDLAVDLGKLAGTGQAPLAQLAHDARVDVLPAISDLAQLLTRELLPHVITLAGHLGNLFGDMEPGLEAAMPVLTDVIDEFSKMVTAVDDLTEGLPGVAKLIPGLLVTSAVIRSWRLLGEAWSLAPGSLKGAGAVARGAVAAPVAAGAAATPTVVAAAGGSTGIRAGARSLVTSPAARALGQSLAIGAAAVFGPQFIERLRQGVSPTSKDFGLEKHQKLDTGLPDLNPLHKAGLPSIDPTSIASKVASTAFDKLIANTDKGKEKLKSFGDTAEDTFKRLSASGNGGGLARLADQARKLGDEFPSARDKLDDFADAVDKAAGGTVVHQFDKMRAASGHSLSEISRQVANTTGAIRDKLGSESAAGEKALAHNFQLAVGAIKTSMDAGKIATETGLKQIKGLITSELALYGIKWTGKQLDRYVHGQDPLTGKPSSTGNEGGGLGAAGGAMIVGRPGEKGRDDVPALLNGQPAVVARGEMVAVLNGHQQKAMDHAARTAGYGGLGQLMASQPKHYMAAGGVVPKRGGVGSLLNLGHELQSEGYQVGENAAFGGVHPVHVNGSYHYRFGNRGALDVNHDQGGEDAALSALASRLIAAGWHTLWHVPGHFDHLHVDVAGGGGSGIGSGGLVPKLKRVAFQKGLGALSQIGQKGLDRVRGAAQDQLAGAVGGAVGGPLETGGGGHGGGGGKGMSKRALMDLWERAGGAPSMARIMAAIALAESGGIASRNNADRPGDGGHHIAAGLWQILGLPFPGNVYDPLTNAKMAVSKLKSQGLGAWEVYTKGTYKNYLAQGGLISAAGGLIDPLLSTADPVTPDKSKKKKAKKVTKVVGLPGVPRPTKAKPHKASKTKTKHVSALFNRLMGVPEVKDPDFTPFDDKRDAIDGQIDGILGSPRFANDSQTITLPVSQALAAGLVSQADVAQSKLAPDDLIEVVNRDGGVDASDRRFHGGITAHASDLMKVLFGRGAILDMLGGGEKGAIKGTELGDAKGLGLQYAVQLASATKQLAEMHAYYEANVNLREDLLDQRRGLEHRRPKNWREQIQADRASIKSYEGYLSKLGGLPEGFKYNRKAVHDRRVQVRGEVKHLQAEIRRLSSGKANVGKANLDRYQRLGRHIHTIGVENDSLQGRVSGDWDPTAGQAGTLSGVIGGLGSNISTVDDVVRGLIVHEIPGVQMQIASDSQDRADWLGTTAPSLPTGSASANDSQRADLLQQMLDTAHRQHAIDVGQFDVLKAFAPLVNARYLGSFAKGLAQVPQDGMAMLHRGEAVVPAPDGPFGTWQSKGGGDVTVQLTFAENSGQLVRLIDARVDGRAAQVSSEQIGNRTRLIAAAPGR